MNPRVSGRAGIVLAGGAGARLGLGIPKARVEVGGRTLVDRAVERLRAVCADVVVVAPLGIDVGPVRARLVPDAPGHVGPLAGLVAGLEAHTGGACAVLGVDFPCVEPGLLGALLVRFDAARRERGAEALVPRPGGVPQPLVAVYAASAAPALRRVLESGERSLRAGLAALRVEAVDEAELERLPGGRDSFLNVNTPAELERARQWLACPKAPS